jgi:hypothetical protein
MTSSPVDRGMTFVPIDDSDMGVFDEGDHIVMILESEYERLKALDKRNDETDVRAMWRQIGESLGFVE